VEVRNWLLIITDGCPGLVAAIQTVYPRVAHQRCCVNKMHNILERVRMRDYEAVKADAQALYRAACPREAQVAFRSFQDRY
jgi:putative transposase